MNESKIPIGLDVSKRTIDVCMLLLNGQKAAITIPNSTIGFYQLLSWLSGIELSSMHACLEPTGRYGRAVALFLHRAGIRVSQVNSYSVLCHGRSKNFRSKTDRIDAYLLADYCLKENPTTWVPMDQSLLELKDIQRRIDSIEEMIRQEENRLEAGLESEFVRKDIEEHLAQLMVRKKMLTVAAKELVRQDPALSNDFAILNSIIGLGEKSVIRLLALVRFSQFTNSRKVACFSGLTPKKHSSGTSIHKREIISRVGSRELRRYLFFPAMVAMQHNPQLRAFADRLREDVTNLKK